MATRQRNDLAGAKRLGLLRIPQALRTLQAQSNAFAGPLAGAKHRADQSHVLRRTIVVRHVTARDQGSDAAPSQQANVRFRPEAGIAKRVRRMQKATRWPQFPVKPSTKVHSALWPDPSATETCRRFLRVPTQGECGEANLPVQLRPKGHFSHVRRNEEDGMVANVRTEPAAKVGMRLWPTISATENRRPFLPGLGMRGESSIAFLAANCGLKAAFVCCREWGKTVWWAVMDSNHRPAD